MSNYHITISIPAFLDRIIASPLLLIRWIWYGYAFRRIPLANCKKFALVDQSNFKELSKYTWWSHKRKGSYSVFRLTNDMALQRPILIHRQIMKEKLNANLVIDHINNKPLDNRKSNLRVATIAQNNMNKKVHRGRSKYKGVVYRANKKLWVARIAVNKKRIYIKSSKSEIVAAKAYDEAAKKYFGRYAYLNFPCPEHSRRAGIEQPKGLRDFFLQTKNFELFSDDS